MARQAEGMERRDAAEYGRFYFHIWQSDKEHSDVYCYADRVEVTPSGALIMWHDNPDAGEVHPNVIFPAGRWMAVYAVSVQDTVPVGIDFRLWDKKEG